MELSHTGTIRSQFSLLQRVGKNLGNPLPPDVKRILYAPDPFCLSLCIKSRIFSIPPAPSPQRVIADMSRHVTTRGLKVIRIAFSLAPTTYILSGTHQPSGREWYCTGAPFIVPLVCLDILNTCFCYLFVPQDLAKHLAHA